MAASKRVIRLNSLLKEVLSEVIRKEVRDPRLGVLITVTSVDITKDLHHAKVHISVIGTPEEKKQSIEALQSAAGFIGVHASKKVVMRFFPSLTFKLDESVDTYMAIDSLLGKIHQEQKTRQHTSDATE
ncbi:MAG: 30S ribosome-binding factor RbfA [Rhabdochlamydiaceae bacterium]|nr:30S ribosome-binding factor RbfA [Rhabdochlamydiaceae bacterium]